MSRWFRMYDSVADDPKVQRLSDKAFRAWVNLMCVASRNGGLISADWYDIGFALRLDDTKAKAVVSELISAGLIDKTDTGLEPHNWKARQYKTDNSTERVKKYREKVRDAGEVVGAYLRHRVTVTSRDGNACIYCGSAENIVLDHVVPVCQNGPGEVWNLVAACKRCNAGKAGRTPFEAKMPFVSEEKEEFCRVAVTRVTVTETAPEQKQNRAEQKVISSAPPAAAPTKAKADRGTRWPKDQPVPNSWHEPVLARFRELGRAPPDIPLEAVKFAAYWTSKSGKDATKLDWPKTFLNWCLNARPDQRKPKQSTHRDFLDAGIDVAREYLADGGDAGGGGGAADPFGRPLLPA